MYVLNLAKDNRILSAWKKLESVDYEDMPIVDTKPDDNDPTIDITDYRYVNGEFIYDPLPEPEPMKEQPTAEEILDVLLGAEVG